MQITNKVYQKALELNLNPNALKGMDILDVTTILYQKYRIYPQVTIKTRTQDEDGIISDKLDFEYSLIKVSIDDFNNITLNSVETDRAETCSLMEAHEIAFCKAVDYINGHK